MSFNFARIYCTCQLRHIISLLRTNYSTVPRDLYNYLCNVLKLDGVVWNKIVAVELTDIYLLGRNLVFKMEHPLIQFHVIEESTNFLRICHKLTKVI